MPANSGVGRAGTVTIGSPSTIVSLANGVSRTVYGSHAIHWPTSRVVPRSAHAVSGEMPISAPKPNCSLSVNAVDARSPSRPH